MKMEMNTLTCISLCKNDHFLLWVLKQQIWKKIQLFSKHLKEFISPAIFVSLKILTLTAKKLTNINPIENKLQNCYKFNDPFYKFSKLTNTVGAN